MTLLNTRFLPYFKQQFKVVSLIEHNYLMLQAVLLARTALALFACGCVRFVQIFPHINRNAPYVDKLPE